MWCFIECRKRNLKKTIANLKRKGLVQDKSFDPLPLDGGLVIIRGEVRGDRLDQVKKTKGVERAYDECTSSLEELVDLDDKDS